MQRHRFSFVLTPVSCEDHPTLRYTAFGANKRVLLDAADSNPVVRDHFHQDQLTTTGSTTHHGSPKLVTYTPSAPALLRV